MQTKALFILIAMPLVSLAQYGGESSFQFLQLTNSARVEALGGTNISAKTDDINIAMNNPALIDSSLNNDFAGSWGSLFIKQTGIATGNVAYSHTIKEQPYTIGARFINYGSFDAYNSDGESQANVSASEMALSFGTSRELLPHLRLGVQAKPLASYMANYSSYALAVDAGLAYDDTAHLVTYAFLLSNMGYQIKTYTKDNQQNMPFDAQLGVTKRLRHAPLRMSVTYRYLQQFDLSYTQLKDKSLVQTEEESKDWYMEAGTNLLRHLTVGAEILLGKKLYFAAGYNFKKSAELALEEGTGGAGLSLGLGVKISKLRISYGRSKYHAAGATNYLTLNANIDDFLTTKHTATPQNER